MTKAEKQHLGNVVDLGCIACRVLGYIGTPSEIHHIRHGMGGGQRNDSYHAIPLCATHHRNGPHGTAFHAGRQAFEARFGTELELLEKVKSLLGIHE